MIKNLFFLGSLALIFTGCSKSTTPEITDPVVVTPVAPYSVTEGFENSTKGGYAIGTIT